MIDLGSGRGLARVGTLSVDPPIFSVDGLLDEEECDSLIDAARSAGLQPMPEHLGLRVDQAFFLQVPAKGTLWDLWRAVDTNSDGHANTTEIQEFVQRRLHIQAFTLEDARRLLVQAHEVRMPAMSRHAFATYDWDALVEAWRRQTPERFARFGDEATLHPGGPVELPALQHLRTRVARALGWPEEVVLPRHGEPLRVVRYGVGGHVACHLDSDEVSADAAGGRPVRAATVRVFLRDATAGGELLFPAGGPRPLRLSQEDLERRCREWCGGALDATAAGQAVASSEGEYRQDGAIPAEIGMRVGPQRGRTVLWYSHYVVGEETAADMLAAASRRNSSLNADCPVREGEQWVASFSVLLRASGRASPTGADATDVGATAGIVRATVDSNTRSEL